MREQPAGRAAPRLAPGLRPGSRRLPGMRVAAALLAAALLAGGCGGGGGGETGGGTSPPTGGTPNPPPAASPAFNGSVLLGSPTDTSVKLSLYSADQSGQVFVAWGTGSFDRQTSPAALVAGEPLQLALDGLAPGTRHVYRVHFLATGSTTPSLSAEYAFRTARPAGSTFTFTLQADSHLDENANLEQYRRTLGNVLADAPDFHIDLGDTFMTEKHSGPFTSVVQQASSQSVVDTRYAYERGNFGLVSHSVPIFLVNGNHEGEAGWLTNGTASNIGVWATLARKRYYLNPVAGGFYGGDTQQEAFVGTRASWYAWTWGDALFVVLDPYWNSAAQASKDGWNLTLGERQYRWLEQTLAASRAAWKFVFIHNLVGGLDGQMRGGIEAAPYFEWGGREADGSAGFERRRPGWGLPVHALLVRHRVTAVFHGHDHFYAHQNLDGVVYQLVPQPAANNTSNGAQLAASYRYGAGTFLSSAGHLRVRVAPDGVQTEYVRAWLPASETAQRRNAQVDHSWSVAPPAAAGRATPASLRPPLPSSSARVTP